jgi:hypothetical protein
MPYKNKFDIQKSDFKPISIKQPHQFRLNQKTGLHDNVLHYFEPGEMSKWLKYNPAEILILGKIKMDCKAIGK